MTDEPETRSTPFHAFHAIDRVDGRALGQALARLPAGATGVGTESLTPSVRAVLDRFLSAPLRRPLRSLGEPDGPSTVVIEQLTGTRDHADPDRPLIAEALTGWMIEAAGLFRTDEATDRPDAGAPPVTPVRSDHLLLLATADPPTHPRSIGCAALPETLALLGQETIEILRQPRFASATGQQPQALGEVTTEVQTPTEVDTPTPVSARRARSLLPAAGSPCRLLTDPRHLRGIDVPAEAARLEILAAVEQVGIDVDLRTGTAVLLDRRRVLVDLDEIGPTDRWLAMVNLVADPWRNRGNQRSTAPGGAS